MSGVPTTLAADARVEFAVVERDKGPWLVASAPPGLRVLSRGECEALPARNVVGRIAFAHRAT